MRDAHGLCPVRVVEFIMNLIDYNDNSDNKVNKRMRSFSHLKKSQSAQFEDGYYVGSLITALATAIELPASSEQEPIHEVCLLFLSIIPHRFLPRLPAGCTQQTSCAYYFALSQCGQDSAELRIHCHDSVSFIHPLQTRTDPDRPQRSTSPISSAKNRRH